MRFACSLSNVTGIFSSYSRGQARHSPVSKKVPAACKMRTKQNNEYFEKSVLGEKVSCSQRY